MWVCEKDYNCVDCPKIYPDEKCDHWIEVVPVIHAEWIEHYNPGFGEKLNPSIECSNCNIYFPRIDMPRRSFCPNCGAKMRGKHE